MGGNVWGAQLPAAFGTFGQTIGNVDIACPAGTTTDVINLTASIAPTAGVWSGLIQGLLVISLGATPPTAIVLSAKFTGGSQFDSYAVAIGALVASATIIQPITLQTPTSKVAFFPASFGLTLSLTPAAQAVTVRAAGTRVAAYIFRFQDQ